MISSLAKKNHSCHSSFGWLQKLLVFSFLCLPLASVFAKPNDVTIDSTLNLKFDLQLKHHDVAQQQITANSLEVKVVQKSNDKLNEMRNSEIEKDDQVSRRLQGSATLTNDINTAGPTLVPTVTPTAGPTTAPTQGSQDSDSDSSTKSDSDSSTKSDSDSSTKSDSDSSTKSDSDSSSKSDSDSSTMSDNDSDSDSDSDKKSRGKGSNKKKKKQGRKSLRGY